MARTKAATANATQQNKLVIDRRIGTLFLENKGALIWLKKRRPKH